MHIIVQSPESPPHSPALLPTCLQYAQSRKLILFNLISIFSPRPPLADGRWPDGGAQLVALQRAAPQCPLGEASPHSIQEWHLSAICAAHRPYYPEALSFPLRYHTLPPHDARHTTATPDTNPTRNLSRRHLSLRKDAPAPPPPPYSTNPTYSTKPPVSHQRSHERPLNSALSRTVFTAIVSYSQSPNQIFTTHGRRTCGQ